MMAYRKILVIAGSGIGNILLATPIIRSLRAACPAATIDVLVPSGRGGILEGNPDVNRIIEQTKRAGLRASLRHISEIWRQYELALSVQSRDRSLIAAWLAAPLRYAQVHPKSEARAWVRFAIQHRVPADFETHVVIHGLRLLDPLKIEHHYELVPPECSDKARAELYRLMPFLVENNPYMVVHPFPRNVYKCWTVDGWHQVIRRASEKGMRVVVTGGATEKELGYIDEIVHDRSTAQVLNMAGQLDLPQVSALLSRASLYVGPDTGITHLAAAHGIPCMALFGPTNPVYWGPWPHGYQGDAPPFRKRGLQRCRNVMVIQDDRECIGCGPEGCYDDPSRPSECMKRLSPDRVLSAMDDLALHPAPAGVRP